MGRIPDLSSTILPSFRFLQYAISIGLGLTSSALLAMPAKANNDPVQDSAIPVPEDVLRSLSVTVPTSSVTSSDLPQPVGLDNLSMARAVELSVERNPKLRSSYLTFRSSQDLLGASYGSWWPTLSLAVGSGVYKYDSNTTGAATNNSEFSDLFSGLFSELSAITSSISSLQPTGGTASSGSASSFDSSSISTAFDSTSGQTEGDYLYTTFTLSLTWDVVNATRPLNIWKSKYQMLQDADRYTIVYRDNALNVKNA